MGEAGKRACSRTVCPAIKLRRASSRTTPSRVIAGSMIVHFHAAGVPVFRACGESFEYDLVRRRTDVAKKRPANGQ